MSTVSESNNLWAQTDQAISPPPFLPTMNEGFSTTVPFIQPTNVYVANTINDAPLNPDETALAKLIAANHLLYKDILMTSHLTRESYRQQGVNWKNPALFKTSVCDSWKNNQICKYGSKCWYAHGVEELRYVPRLDQIPVLLESLSTLPSNLAQSTSSLPEILPLEFYQTTPPPTTYPVMSLQQQQQQEPNHGYTTETAYSGTPSDYENQYRTASSPFYPCAFVNPYMNAQEVQGIPGIITGTDTESIISDSWFSGQQGFPTTDFNNSIVANFKQKVQNALLENQEHSDLNGEWEEIANFIEKKRGREFSDSSCEEPTSNSGRAFFLKSFHPFGQSYPLNNWL
uniref:C3H1-type domain-containing protein n=1 Tax=Acrobeloides nanus TaxID=290746 RepID=A0A914EBY2_9BILA